jgi:hypothetical protein
MDDISEIIASFPATFGLRSRPGEVFRISKAYSYVNDDGIVMLYTEVKRGNDWLSYAKGTVEELEKQIPFGEFKKS